MDADYTISYVAGTLTVTPAPLTITADNQTQGLRGGAADLDGQLQRLRQRRHAGQPDDAAHAYHDGDGRQPRSGSPTRSRPAARRMRTTRSATCAGTLTVTPAPLTITANNQSKVYGAALPALTASYTGFVNGDTAASLRRSPRLPRRPRPPATSGSPYTITASGAVDPDYTISYVAGTLTVTPAPLTITADNQSKVYGAALPTLTASYSGFVNGDTAASLTTQPTLTTTATAASHVRAARTRSRPAGSGCGLHDQLRGRDADRDAGAADDHGRQPEQGLRGGVAALTASYSGFVNGDTAASLTTQPTLTTTATAASHVSGSPTRSRPAARPIRTTRSATWPAR